MTVTLHVLHRSSQYTINNEFAFKSRSEQAAIAMSPTPHFAVPCSLGPRGLKWLNRALDDGAGPGRAVMRTWQRQYAGGCLNTTRASKVLPARVGHDGIVRACAAQGWRRGLLTEQGFASAGGSCQQYTAGHPRVQPRVSPRVLQTGHHLPQTLHW